MDRSIYLKVKIKSLAEEARIIRREEHLAKQRKEYGWVNSLCEHRKAIVRPEARATQLAYAFLRGRSYAQVEPKPRTKPSWARVKAMVEKYGPFGVPNVDALLKQWRNGESLFTLRRDSAACEG